MVNFLVATMIMTGVYLTRINDDPGRVDQVSIGAAAYSQGIRPGDSILTTNGRPVRNPADIRRAEDAGNGAPMVFTVRHEHGGTFTATVKPVYDKNQKRYFIGILSADLVSPGQAFQAGLRFPFVAAAGIGQGV